MATDLKQVLLAWSTVFLQVSMHDFVHHMRDTGLSFPQMNVLTHLHYRGPTEVLHLASEMLGSPAAASQMVERLAQAGLVERVESPGDRRVRLVRLTPRGQQVVADSIAAREAWVERLVDSLTEEERAGIGEALELLTEHAARLEDDPPGTSGGIPDA
jgi:DNA-binding MarR family transcriptional regulator